MQVLTFDFHNTLAQCDPWFDLEVRDLPWAVIERLELAAGSPRETVDQAYRALRLDVIASGNEIDAYESVLQVFDGLGLSAAAEDVARAIDDLMLESTGAMSAVPGAVDTVRHLHAAGVRLGVVSSAVHHRTLEVILERLGIGDCFGAVITSASSGYYKSTTSIYKAALHALGGHPAGSIHVGDSLKWDVAMAQQTGMAAVWLRTPRKEVFSAPDYEATPDLVLDTLVGAGPALEALLARLGTPGHA